MSQNAHKQPVGAASKRQRQAAWEERCDRLGLSVAERNRAASIIPAGVPIKVLRWPSSL
jgi:hypothetical protein